ncbi:hypothetical protein RJ640_015931 [Escallonia rubra]|uniref:F-box domain-containing protein n=1 Tax=Escallonia rubra TaxID=112253 RepID=A0AA88RK59_9ASTE|nr:hypothetical protein RJ640_015931 [Escallonia rubra]
MASTSRQEPPAKRHRDWADLPTEVTAMILHKLGAVGILESAQKVCPAWLRTCKDPATWRTIDMRNKGLLCSKVLYFEKMVMHAVDRSYGQLVDISVQSFLQRQDCQAYGGSVRIGLL